MFMIQDFNAKEGVVYTSMYRIQLRCEKVFLFWLFPSLIGMKVLLEACLSLIQLLKDNLKVLLIL